VIKKSAEKAKKKGFAKVVLYDTGESLVAALKNREIDSAVRGTLGAKKTIGSLKSDFKLERVYRIVLMVMAEKRLILLCPVGVDEGQSVDERMEMIKYGSEFLSKFKIEPKIGILSGGRLEDFGRHLAVDKTLMEGERLMSMTLDLGVSARHYGILLERAAKESNMLVAPDGISGNLIFRALNFFGGARGIGAPVVNLKEVFVDTSREKEDYCDSIALASALYIQK
jgi:putative methanogen marker protein 4